MAPRSAYGLIFPAMGPALRIVSRLFYSACPGAGDPVDSPKGRQAFSCVHLLLFPARRSAGEIAA